MSTKNKYMENKKKEYMLFWSQSNNFISMIKLHFAHNVETLLFYILFHVSKKATRIMFIYFLLETNAVGWLIREANFCIGIYLFLFGITHWWYAVLIRLSECILLRKSILEMDLEIHGVLCNETVRESNAAKHHNTPTIIYIFN